MLVLSRKKNESIVIDDEIVVKIIEIHGNRVRLGVEAPAEIPVHRGEVQRQMEATTASHRCNSTGTTSDACNQDFLLA